MQTPDNINFLWSDVSKKTIKSSVKQNIAASCFSIYAYEALKKELEKVDSPGFFFHSTCLCSQRSNKQDFKRESGFFYSSKTAGKAVVRQRVCNTAPQSPTCHLLLLQARLRKHRAYD